MFMAGAAIETRMNRSSLVHFHVYVTCCWWVQHNIQAYTNTSEWDVCVFMCVPCRLTSIDLADFLECEPWHLRQYIHTVIWSVENKSLE